MDACTKRFVALAGPRILIAKVFPALLITLGVWQFGAGGYTIAKAWLAQQLIESAWAETLAQNNLRNPQPQPIKKSIVQSGIKPWHWADTWPVARLRIPNVQVNQVVLHDVTGRTLAFSPGWMVASAAPGEPGNTIISGHRDTHFRFMGKLAVGMSIHIEDPQGRQHEYQVKDRWIANIHQDQLRLDSPNQTDNQLLLVTCWPLDALTAGGPERLVVLAQPVPTKI